LETKKNDEETIREKRRRPMGDEKKKRVPREVVGWGGVGWGS